MALWPFNNGFAGISKEFFQSKIDTFLFNTFLESSPFADMMGNNHDKPIYEVILNPHGGYAVTVGRRKFTDYKNPILDQQQARGIAQEEEVDSEVMTIRKIRFKIDSRDLDITDLATQIIITEGEARRLAEKHQLYRDYKTFASATIDAYNIAVNGSMPRASRVVAGNLVDGQADGNYAYDGGANLPAALLAAMPNARAAAHRMSVAHIRRLRAKAINRFEEDALKPAEVLTYKGFDVKKFWLFLNTRSAQQLRDDPVFRELYLSRGALLPNQPNPITGADFMGEVDGVFVVECPAMDDPDFFLDGRHNWNLFFGASAWSIGWKKTLTFVQEDDKIEDSRIHLAKQHMGLKALQFPTRVPGQNYKVEQGIIHSFTRN